MQPLRDRLDAVVGIVDFFVPIDVAASVLLVFALENVLDSVLGDIGAVGWLIVYLTGLALVSVLTYASADDDEREELAEDIDDL